MKIEIFRAADAFIYLPLYIAEKLGIFKRFNVEVKFADVPKNANGGDDGAIKSMLSSNSADTIYIAIADPTSFLLHKDIVVKGKDKKEEIQVIGGLINKPPFWAIDHCDEGEASDIRKLGARFKNKTLIVPRQRYVTINGIGKEVSRYMYANHSEEQIENCDFGKEFDKLRELQKGGKKDNEVLVLSGDVVSIAENLVKNNRLVPQFFFADMGKEFAVTGILANKKQTVDKDNDEVFVNFLGAIQTAVLIIQNCCSGELINILSNDEEFSRILLKADGTKGEVDEKEKKEKLIELIRDANFYPTDLRISEEAWVNSLEILRQVDVKTYEDNAVSIKSYHKYTNFEFANRLKLNVLEARSAELEKLKNKTWLRRLCKSIASSLKQHPIYTTWIVGIIGMAVVWLFGSSINPNTNENFIDTNGRIGASITILFGIIGLHITLFFFFAGKRRSQNEK